MIVRPVCEALTTEVGVVRVPEPLAALTVMLGEEPRFVSVPALRAFCWACQVCAPVLRLPWHRGRRRSWRRT